MTDKPFEVEPGNRVAVLLFGYYCVVRVKRVFEGKVLYPDSKVWEDETLFETKSGLVWSTEPCGHLLSFHGGGNGEGYEPAGAPKTWIRRVLESGEKQEDDWAVGEE